MKVHDTKRIHDFIKAHADAKANLEVWLAEAHDAQWQSPKDVKDRYPSASILSDNRVIFNIGGNKYRLLVKIAYNTQIVLVKQIGTHAEYNKWTL